MPFKSEAQRRWMYANKPVMAEKWQAHTPKGKKLPEHVKNAEVYERSLVKAAQILPQIGQTLKRYGQLLRGGAGAEIVAKHQPEYLKNRLVRDAMSYYPESKGVFRDFGRDVIEGRQKVPLEVLEKSKAHKAMVRALEKGRKAFASERRKVWLARGGTAAAVLTPAAVVGYREKTSAKKKDESMIPAVVGGAVGALPLAHGMYSKALPLPERGVKTVRSEKDLFKLFKPGDVVMSGDPKKGDIWKHVISLLGGDPHGYHGAVVSGKGRAGVDVIEANPYHGGAEWTTVKKFDPDEDIVIRRLKDPKLRKRMAKAVRDRAIAQQAFEGVMGSRAAGRLYPTGQAISAGLKSMLPNTLRQALSCKPSAGRAVCSTLPTQASPIPLVPGVPAHEVMPHELRRTPVLETVAKYRAPMTRRAAAHNVMLKAAPWLLRAGAGAGLGYGAYRAAKALSD